MAMVGESGCTFGTLNGPFPLSVNFVVALIFVRGTVHRLPGLIAHVLKVITGDADPGFRFPSIRLVPSDFHISRSPHSLLLFDPVVHRSPGCRLRPASRMIKINIVGSSLASQNPHWRQSDGPNVTRWSLFLKDECHTQSRCSVSLSPTQRNQSMSKLCVTFIPILP